MPLSASPPSPHRRELVHTRSLDIRAYRRDDGLYDVEGHLTDVKPFAYELADNSVGANQPVHDMWLRLTLDATGRVERAEAVMDSWPHSICNLVTPNFARLEGLALGAGWNRNVRERLGGTQGCTHLVQMLAQLATTALQAIWADEEQGHRDAGREPPLDPGILNSCYTYDQGSAYVRDHFPGHHVPVDEPVP